MPPKKFTSGTEGPKIPFPDQVINWVRLSVSSTSDINIIGTALDDPVEIESLRHYTESCIGLPVTETDVVTAIHKIMIPTEEK